MDDEICCERIVAFFVLRDGSDKSTAVHKIELKDLYHDNVLGL
jgi:hypothetical protein